MNAANPLSALKDIVPAGEIYWWPLAPGWWLIILLALAGLIGSVVWARNKHRSKRWKREALEELEALHRRYFDYVTPNTSMDTGISEIRTAQEAVEAASHLNQELNVLLKRILSSRNPKKDVRALSPKAWSQVLMEEVPVLSVSEVEIVVFGHYQTSVPRLPSETFIALRKWLRKLA